MKLKTILFLTILCFYTWFPVVGQSKKPRFTFDDLKDKKLKQALLLLKLDTNNFLPGRIFIFDKKIKVYYGLTQLDSSHSVFEVYTFDNNIVRVTEIKGASNDWGSIGHLVNDYFYPGKKEAFETYFKAKYGIMPLYDSVNNTYINLLTNNQFGIYCGIAAYPTQATDKYLALKDKNLNSQQIKNLILSINKTHRITGLLLFDPKKHCDITPTFLQIALQNDKFSFCYGCEPGPPLNLTELRHWVLGE